MLHFYTLSKTPLKVLAFVGSFFLIHGLYAANNTAFCNTVTDVTVNECLALMDIYDNTSGTSWTTKTGWGTSTTVCSWYGVTSCSVSSGPNTRHVLNLSLTNNNLSGQFYYTNGNLNWLTTLTINTNPLITSVTFSNNTLTSFSGGSGMTGLTSVDISNNQLTSPGVSGASNLVTLNVSGNKFTELNNNTNLSGLSSLTSLDVRNNPNITYIGFSNGKLNTFIASNLPKISTISLSGNKLTSFDATGLTSLVTLWLQDQVGATLTSFTGSSGLSNLQTLYLRNNALTSFDATGLTSLVTLWLNNNNITSLSNLSDLVNVTSFDISNNANLTTFSFSNGKLTSFLLSGLSSLTSLNLSGNRIATFYGNSIPSTNVLQYLNLSNNTTLTSFNPSGHNMNALKELHLDNTPLTSVSFVSTNKLTTFTGNGMSSLTYLSLQNNALTGFDNTGMTVLSTLILSNNQLTSFSATNYPALTSLSLNGNQISSLNLSGMSNLTTLNVSSNPLTSFAFSNGKLSSFTLGGLDQLTSLDLSGNKLTSFYGNSFGTNNVLQYLNLSNNTTLTSFNPNGHNLNALKELYLDNTGLASISFSSTSKLTAFTAKNTPSLTSLSLINNALSTFDASGSNNIASLNVSNNLLSGTFDCGISYPLLTSLTLSNNNSISTVNCSNGNLSSFSGSSMAGLTSLNLSGNKITSFYGYNYSNSLVNINLSNNLITTVQSITTAYLPNLRTLDLSNNRIDINGIGSNQGYNTALTSLNLSGNRLVSFSGTNWTSVTSLNLSNNKNVSNVPLSSLTPSGLSALASLDLSGNGFTTLPTAISTLRTLNISNNALSSSLISTGWSGLTSLNASNNQLTTFSGTGWSGLNSLNLSTNSLTSFTNSSGLNSLTTLNVSNNQLTSLSPISTLTSLNTSNNHLSSFDGTGMTALTSLSIDHNDITTLTGVTGITGLTSLYATTNCLSRSGLIPSVSSWLDQYALDTWSTRSNSCLSFCSTVTDVDESQCDALMALHENTNGASWTTKTGWGTATEVCGWFGVTCTGNTVTNLILSGNNLTGSFWITQGNLNGITSLNLSNNSLSIFKGLGLANTQSINLSGNALTSVDGSGLTALTTLNLSDNTALTSLSFSNGLLSSFTGTGMSGLQSLNLSGNALTSFAGSTTTPITSLNLSDNPLTSFDGSNFTALTSLNLSNNTSLSSLTFSNGLLSSFTGTGMSGLQSLNLSGNALTSFAGSTTTPITSLNLSDNPLTSFDGSNFTALTSLNLSNNTSLSSLTFSNGLLSSFTGTGMSGLQSLNLSGNALTSFAGMGMNSLITLNLSSNNFSSFSGTGMSSVTSLNLSDNILETFSGVGLTGLTNLIITNNLLQNLDTISHIGSVSITNNCLVRDRLSGALTSWLSGHSTDNWEIHNNACIIPIIATCGPSSTAGITGDVIQWTANASGGTGIFSYAWSGTDGLTGIGNPLGFSYNTAGTKSTTVTVTSGGQTTEPIMCTNTTISPPVVVTFCDTITDVSKAECEALSDIYDTTSGANWTDKTGWKTSTEICNWYGVTCNGTSDHIASLDLSENNLVGSFGFLEGSLNYLTDIDISNNALTEFVGTGFNTLTSLDISYNSLTSFSGTGLRTLRHLYIDHNNLSTFDGTALNYLWTLNISNNHIASLSKVTGMKKMKNLTANINCLARSRLDSTTVGWLDKYHGDTLWENQSPGCTAEFVVPVLSNITQSSATISWTTPTLTSTKLEYGLSAQTRSGTQEQDITPRVTEHSVTLTGLAACTTYDYRVISEDANALQTTSVGNTFITLGCTGSSSVIETSTEQINKEIGGVLVLEKTNNQGDTLNSITLTIPSGFASSDANFQSQQLDKSSVISTLSTPNGTALVEDLIYELKAIKDDSNIISTFEEPLTMTMSYNENDVIGIKEETLKIYSSDGESAWSALPSCEVNTTEKTVTCDTTHFSVFALFGEEEDSIPTVSTPTVSNISATGATLGATVISGGIPDTLTARGTCWGTSANPATNCVAEGDTAIGIFTQNRTGLTPNTLYYYRGYATNATGTAYSPDGTFTTSSTQGEVDNTPPATPIATPNSGTYGTTQTVSISAEGSTMIRYSTTQLPENCSTGTLYSTPITVSTSQTLYVRACDNASNSSTQSFTYTITQSSGGGGGGGGSSYIDNPPKTEIKEIGKVQKNLLNAILALNFGRKRYSEYATRLDVVLFALKVGNFSLVPDYICQKIHTDTLGGIIPLYTCQVAEKARTVGIISQKNTEFNPLKPISRIETYSIMMKSICIHPKTTSQNWQTVVINKAIELGFTVRTLNTFEPDRPLLMSEMYAVVNRLMEYGKTHNTCGN